MGSDPATGGEGHASPVPDEDGEDEDRTSALKEKRLPREALAKIKMRLRLGSRSRAAPLLRDWLDAGILTGLRPSEWRATDLVLRDVPVSDEHPWGRLAYLYVISAKATNGRGTGVARTLDLSLFGDEDLATVRRHVAACRSMLEARSFPRHKARAGELLRETCAALWPDPAGGTGPKEGRHYALYSCRHQAIANWKAVGMPLEEIAALVGHGVTDTVQERYGKRRSAWQPADIPVPPRPVPEEVGLVRQRVNLFKERMRLAGELGIPYSGPTEFPL